MVDKKYYYNIVWTDYQYEKELTTAQMQEKEHVDEMIKRVEHMKWKDEQRAAWMGGESPQIPTYVIPDDCPF